MPQKTSSGVLSNNRSVRFHYEIIERFEAGIELTGRETKACRVEHPNLRGAHIAIAKNGSAVIKNLDIPPYRFASNQPYERRRDRRLLLNARELVKIRKMTEEKGVTAVPLNIHLKGPWIKVEIVLGRGKKKWDKRETIKNRDVDRQTKREMR